MSNSTSNHFTCPSGGTWYVCPEAPYFVGCCSSDPCTNVDANSTAPCQDVYPASFDPSIYNDILSNSCIDPANSKWYTCAFTDPPFIGCCSKNNRCPSNEVACSDDDVLAAAWNSSRPSQFTLFLDAGTDDDDDGDSGERGGGGLSDGVLAGIVVGAVAALVIAGALVWLFMRRRNKKAAAMSGHGHTPSVVEGEHQRMYPGEYGYQHSSPASPYHDSRFSSPDGTQVGAGNNPKYMSTSSAGFSLPSFSPGIPSESGRPIHEMHSISGSEDMPQQKWAPGQNYGLGMHGAQEPEPIQELDGNMAEVHELEGGNRPL
ncbi:hypothetical protein N7466_011391 [Penicillium verhagenii]|uniref:uncharacterized protein n=1 Tax=Penicillium verhagenii TaxID=1562060 RepID=UPI0025450987|nr:uncharacterized protein N7466_011391 [Penicillium verhagenii]KAJ5915458.1 hypothetical protein N7466_011391 [Penicillium verhagenii]